MSSFISIICLVGMVIPATIGNIIFYPTFRKISVKISDYIVETLAPRLFAILRTYKHFHLWKYDENREKLPQQFLVISNHQSLLDIPLYMVFFRNKNVRFVAKDALARHVPLVSEMLRAHEHCMIPRRAKPMEAMAVMDAFGKRVLSRGQIPVLFPEGTRTKDGNVGKFYSAGFRKLTESTGLPVVACALEGGYQLRDLRRIFTKLKRGSYRVKILKVYDCPKSKEDCNAVLEDARQLIQSQLEEWRKLKPLEKY